MTITKQKNAPATRSRILLFSLGSLVVGVVLLLLFVYLGRPPQMGADEEVFRTVDALFTAVTAHDNQRLADCQQRLSKYKDRGSLPPAAAQRLDRIISLAQSGDWTTAARRLYDFMQAQRRLGDPAAPRQRLTAMNAR